MQTLLLDNIIFSLQRVGGVSRYWGEILSRFLADDKVFEASFLEYAEAENNIFRQQINLPMNMIHKVAFPFSGSLFRFFPVALKNPAIFHSSYYRYATGVGVKNIVTVYDCVYERFSGSLSKKLALNLKRKALNAADAVICISQSTANDVLRYYPQVNSNAIVVTYLGVGDKFYPLENIEQSIEVEERKFDKGSFLLYVGQRSRYKNFDVLLQALARMGKKSDEVPFLIVAGGEKDFSTKQRSFIAENGLTDKIIKIPGCSSEFLNKLYNMALGFVYTSQYEGFGLPVLEAMKAGCAVVCADNSSLQEVAGDAALLFNADSVVELADCLKHLYNSQKTVELRRRGIRRANLFSWDKTYQQTKEIYLSLQ